jgi:hypothetical protein
MNVIDNFTLAVGGTTAVGLESASPALIGGYMSGRTVYHMIVSVDDGDVRWRADGADPTPTVGHAISDGGSLSLTGANWKSVIKSIKFVGVAGTAAIFGTAFD